MASFGASLGNIRGLLRGKIEKAKSIRTYPPFRIREPRHLIILPSIKIPSRINLEYPLLEPFVTAHIRWDQRKKQLVYNVVEPPIAEEEKQGLEHIKSQLTEMIDVKISFLEDRKQAMHYLEDKINTILDDLGLELDPQTYLKVLYHIYRDFVGLNEIEPLMHDPYIEDIGCTGMDTDIHITHRKFGSMATNISFTDFEVLSNFVIKLSERCGRYISYAMPLLDGTLPDGSRIQASLAKDVTTKGPTFSIRRFRRNPFSPIDIVNFKTASSRLMAYLWLLVEYDSSILVAGGVSAGKTTLLNTLSSYIPHSERVVTIVDIQRALASLPDQLRTLVQMVYYDDQTATEVAVWSS